MDTAVFPYPSNLDCRFSGTMQANIMQAKSMPTVYSSYQIERGYLKDEHATTLAICESCDVRRCIKEGEDVEDTLRVKPWQNALWYFPRVELYDLLHTDILHTF